MGRRCFLPLSSVDRNNKAKQEDDVDVVVPRDVVDVDQQPLVPRPLRCHLGLDSALKPFFCSCNRSPRGTENVVKV